MVLNVDTRVFNFILPKKWLPGSGLGILWFYRDCIRINEPRSLLIIPCKNDEIKGDRPLGLKFKTLRKNIAHKGEKVEIELFVRDENCEEFKLKDFDPAELGINSTQKIFVCVGENHFFKCKSVISSKLYKLDAENKEFKWCESIDATIFKDLFFSGSNILKIGGGELYLRVGNKFNGLDKNKNFDLYYSELGKNKLYKVVQDNVTLYEIGSSIKEG